jgi:hypothetical protein
MKHHSRQSYQTINKSLSVIPMYNYIHIPNSQINNVGTQIIQLHFYNLMSTML